MAIGGYENMILDIPKTHVNARARPIAIPSRPPYYQSVRTDLGESPRPEIVT